MGFIWRLATPSIADHESADGDFTWENYATKIFNIIHQCHLNATEYHLVNDRYDVELSVKDAENQKRNAMFLEAEIFSLQVLLQPHQQETLTASLEMQRTR